MTIRTLAGSGVTRPQATNWYSFSLLLLCVLATPCLAGPPYVTDDPEPTDYEHFEIYLFGSGTAVRGDSSGETGIDFNYGVAPDVQLTAVIPVAYDKPAGERMASGLGNVELAVKYRFLHQATSAWDVSFFPRVFLPSASRVVGEQHASVLLPFWAEKDWDAWSTFGGGGCALNRRGESRNFCIAGWGLTRQLLPELQLGAELYHQTPDLRGGRAATGVGVGIRYDINDKYHLMASGGPGIQNVAETNRYSWYAAILFTF